MKGSWFGGLSSVSFEFKTCVTGVHLRWPKTCAETLRNEADVVAVSLASPNGGNHCCPEYSSGLFLVAVASEESNW